MTEATRSATEDAQATSEFVISRTFNAPRELVFKAYTDGERLSRWWGPKGWNMKVVTADVRPGGIFHYVLETSGNEWWGKFVYREVVAPERLVFVSSFSDPDGNVTRAPFNENFPLEVLNILTLEEQDGKTTVTLRGGPLNATEAEHKFYVSMRSSMQQGFKGTFDQLEEYLASVQ